MDSAVYRGVMSMLLMKKVCDFGKDNKCLVDVPWEEIEDHHIYPNRFLGPYGIKGETANNIANRTPILRSTNNAIKNDAPQVYLEKTEIVGAKGLRNDILEEHCIDPKIARTPFTKDVYERFIKSRTIRVLKLISELVGTEPIEDE